MRLNPHSTSPTFELLTSNRMCPEIRFLKTAVMKQEEYVDLSPDEVGWMGFVEKVNDLLYVVSDTFILPQEVSSTKTHIDANVWFQLDEMLSKEKLQKVRLWGHSHVNMACSASSEDDKTMETLALGVDWFIRVILNKKGEMRVSFFNYEEGIAFHDCPWSLPEDKPRDKLRKTIESELEEMVRPIKVSPPVIVDSKKVNTVPVPSVGAKMWDVEKKEMVTVKSSGHGRHLLRQLWASQGEKTTEQVVDDWFQDKNNLFHNQYGID